MHPTKSCNFRLLAFTPLHLILLFSLRTSRKPTTGLPLRAETLKLSINSRHEDKTVEAEEIRAKNLLCLRSGWSDASFEPSGSPKRRKTKKKRRGMKLAAKFPSRRREFSHLLLLSARKDFQDNASQAHAFQNGQFAERRIFCPHPPLLCLLITS